MTRPPRLNAVSRLGGIGSLVSKSVTKDQRSPNCVNENLGIMRFHSVSPATIQAFVSDLDTADPLTGLSKIRQ